ncbi:hypothetical protein [Methylobacterium nigriterrae]|uniref:hypothetical protein n=1 Tax=Methylobacterium nigriterrae TaxID=3127512 RepID=UPI003013C9DB
MTEALWHESITDDFKHDRAFSHLDGVPAPIAQEERVKELLQAQAAGEFRLRLILSEAVDLKKVPQHGRFW